MNKSSTLQILTPYTYNSQINACNTLSIQRHNYNKIKKKKNIHVFKIDTVTSTNNVISVFKRKTLRYIIQIKMR